MPFIVRWGANDKGGVVSQMASFADIMPTLADIAGVEAPANDGVSLAPVLLKETAGGRGFAAASGMEVPEQQVHESLYWEFPASKGWVAVRIGDWKGLLRKVQEGNSEMELYNIKEDPRETENLAAVHPEIIGRMWEVVRESHEPANPAVPKFCMEIPSPER